MYLVYKGYYDYIPVEANLDKDAAVELAKTLEGGSVWEQETENFIYEWGDMEEQEGT